LNIERHLNHTLFIALKEPQLQCHSSLDKEIYGILQKNSAEMRIVYKPQVPNEQTKALLHITDFSSGTIISRLVLRLNSKTPRISKKYVIDMNINKVEKMVSGLDHFLFHGLI